VRYPTPKIKAVSSGTPNDLNVPEKGVRTNVNAAARVYISVGPTDDFAPSVKLVKNPILEHWSWVDSRDITIPESRRTPKTATDENARSL
jgi:hypothetical protein